jgi:hypothetical protein
MTRMVNAVWQRQAAFVQGEALASMKGFGPIGTERDPARAATAYLGAMHNSLERAVTETRAMQDILRDGAWQIFGLYAAFLPNGPQRTET